MTTGNDTAQNARIWQTLWESPTALKAILLGTFVNNAGGFLSIFIVLYVRSKGYSVVLSTAAPGGIAVGSMLGLLVGGTLYVRLGPRAATVLSMTGSGVLTIALVYLPGYPLLVADAVLIGLVGSVFGPAAATLLSALTPPDRQVMIFALSRFSLNLGVTVAPLIGFGLYYLDHERYTLVFWGDGITSLAYAMLALVALSARRLPPRPRQDSGGQRHGGYGAVLRDRRYLLYLIAAFLGVAVYVQFQRVLPLEVTAKYHHNSLWYVLAVVLNGLVVIGLELLVTKRAQKWTPRVAIGISYLLIAVGVSAYGLPLVPAVIIIGTVIFSLGEILGGPATFAYAAMAGPAELKSYYISSFQFVFELGLAAGSIAAGLFAVIGHWVWPVFGAAEIAGLLLILAATRRSRPAPALSPTPDTQAPAAAPATPRAPASPGNT